MLFILLYRFAGRWGVLIIGCGMGLIAIWAGIKEVIGDLRRQRNATDEDTITLKVSRKQVKDRAVCPRNRYGESSADAQNGKCIVGSTKWDWSGWN